MQLRFIEKGHKYESRPIIKWTSVTRVVENLSDHFDENQKAFECSQKERSPWYGIRPDMILDIWHNENLRSTDCGHWYHDVMEKKAYKAGSKLYKGHQLSVIPGILKPGYKLAPNQQLEPGIYPEHFMYDERYGICGQSDLVYQYDDYVDIDDYKTNKELKMRGYGYHYGNPQMMNGIVSHLEDCNFNHYCLQLNIYMKLILLKNPHLKPGRMRIYHVEFEKAGKDKYGFPILKRTPDGGYIVKSGKWHTIPYLPDEVEKIFDKYKIAL